MSAYPLWYRGAQAQGDQQSKDDSNLHLEKKVNAIRVKTTATSI